MTTDFTFCAFSYGAGRACGHEEGRRGWGRGRRPKTGWGGKEAVKVTVQTWSGPRTWGLCLGPKAGEN